MGVCTACGYITDDSMGETHECRPAYILIGKKARQTAQEALISDGVLTQDGLNVIP